MANGILTDKQRRFVEEYLLDSNAAGAYRRAGYRAANDHVAAANAYKLMTRHDISEAIKDAQDARSGRVQITQDWVLCRLAVEATLKGEGSSHSARVAALKLLGQHQGMFADRLEVAGVIVHTLEIAHDPGRQPAPVPDGDGRDAPPALPSRPEPGLAE